MDFVLELKGIPKRFGSLTANDKISLSVRKGTVHAVIGENGAGKSTLMNVISGLYRPDEGELFVHGKKMDFRNPNHASRAGIGMVHQEFMLFPELSVLDNIMMGYEKRRWGIFLNRDKARRKVEDICEEYHFNIPLDERVQDLSVSMLQQVEIVKILYRGVDIIIFDEPTSVLTPQGVEGLFEAVRFLVKNGKTVLFITHKLKEVMEISDSITVLKNGRYVGTVKPEETDEHGLATMMVGREVILTAQKQDKKQGDVLLQVKHLCVPDHEGRDKLKDVSFEIRKGDLESQVSQAPASRNWWKACSGSGNAARGRWPLTEGTSPIWAAGNTGCATSDMCPRTASARESTGKRPFGRTPLWDTILSKGLETGSS